MFSRSHFSAPPPHPGEEARAIYFSGCLEVCAKFTLQLSFRLQVGRSA